MFPGAARCRPTSRSRHPGRASSGSTRSCPPSWRRRGSSSGLTASCSSRMWMLSTSACMAGSSTSSLGTTCPFQATQSTQTKTIQTNPNQNNPNPNNPNQNNPNLKPKQPKQPKQPQRALLPQQFRAALAGQARPRAPALAGGAERARAEDGA